MWIFLKKIGKCGLSDSKRYNYAFTAFAQTWNGSTSSPGLFPKKKPWGRGWKWIRIGASVDPGEKLPHERDGDGLRKIRIKFSLIKKINLGVAYALFNPSSKRKVFSPFKYRCFLMKFAEGMKSVINISRAQDKEKIWIPDINWTYMTYRTPVGCSNHWATLDLWRAGPYRRLMFYMRLAKISDFDMY